MRKNAFKIKILCLLNILLLYSGCSNKCFRHVEREDWADDVKNAVNTFIDLYGNKSNKYDKKSYVVFDFDNTCSIFDMCEQFVIYQAEVMGYGFKPDELPVILSSGIGDKETDLSSFGYGKGTYNDWISDIVTAYTSLYNTYGPFNPSGLNEETSQKIQQDPLWSEFTAKMMNLYLLIEDNESIDISYPWITYWLSGMTEQEVYDLARKSCVKYRGVDTCSKTIRSPDNIESKVGTTKYTYIEGVQVTENIKELWQALDTAGIDVWICSATQSDIIRAAVDEFGLHNYCTGLIGMTPSIKDGKLSYTYDYESGYEWYANNDGNWKRGTSASGAQTQGPGKVTAIENICVSQYGCGPLAGFMDSTGDYNFCTEFKNLKLVICFNRGDRKVTDGGSVIAEIAVYQKNDLGYDLKKANDAEDTLYVLQGRDENGKRTFRNSNKTIKLGDTEDLLFRDEKNDAIYSYIKKNAMATEEAINTFAINTSEDNPLGFRYGFLNKYDGYHSK